MVIIQYRFQEILKLFWQRFISFLPDFLTGIFILLTGWLVSQLVKKTLIMVFYTLKIDLFFKRAKIINEQQLRTWWDFFVGLISWLTLIIFFIPVFEVWRLPGVVNFINQVLLYFPNIIIAVIIFLLGVISSNYTYSLIRHSLPTSKRIAKTLSLIGRGFVVFFTFLVILNQLGVAQDLIKILFTGIVASVGLAFGIAFGLGGKEIAKEILKKLLKKLNE